jgi:nitrogen regulatory protein P-II 1
MLITVVVQRGVADQVVQVALEAGAQGATVFHAHGTGVRQKHLGILGLTVNTEKEIIYIVVPSEQADTMFERIFVSAKMDTPGMGILWMTDSKRCPPMCRTRWLPALACTRSAANECAGAHRLRRREEADHGDCRQRPA